MLNACWKWMCMFFECGECMFFFLWLKKWMLRMDVFLVVKKWMLRMDVKCMLELDVHVL